MENGRAERMTDSGSQRAETADGMLWISSPNVRAKVPRSGLKVVVAAARGATGTGVHLKVPPNIITGGSSTWILEGSGKRIHHRWSSNAGKPLCWLIYNTLLQTNNSSTKRGGAGGGDTGLNPRHSSIVSMADGQPRPPETQARAKH